MTQSRLLRAQPRHSVGPLTPAQIEVVATSAQDTSALCVLGGPGTGKTTALVACVVDRVRAGADLSQIVVLTSSRPAAQRLRARIMAELGTTQRGLQVTTVHGWCLQLLHRFAAADDPAPRLLSAPEQEFRVRELLDGSGDELWPADLRPALGTRGFAREIRAILARARQLGFDPDDLARASELSGRAEWGAVARFFGEYLDVLDAEQVIDYAELVHRARLTMLDASTRSQLPQFAKHIFCDEFAELDRGMIHLLADAYQAGATVTAFADPDTSVFGFRGADPRAVADFSERFNRSGAPARTIELTENLRGAPGVVAALDQVAARLPHLGVTHTAGGAPDPQRVQVLVGTDPTSQALQIAEVLRRAHLVDGIEWAQMAVLTRSGRNAVATLARRLAAAGVPVQVAGDEVALADELAVRHLLSVLQAAAQLAEHGTLDARQAARLLRTPLGGLDALGLRRLGRELRRRAAELDPDQPVSPSGQLIAEELIAVHLVGEEQPAGELANLVALRVLLADLAQQIKQRVDLPSLVWQAWSRTSWPAQLQAVALSGGENAARAHRDLDAVLALFDVAGREVSWAGASGVRSLVAEVSGQQIPADTARESDPRSLGVSVATVHRSKGEQWKVVVLTGLQEGEWPALGTSNGVLRADLLGADGLQDPATSAERLSAERRSLLLGASRATDRLVVMAIDDPSGQIAGPSRFIAELGVPVRPAPIAELPTTLDGLVSQLRRFAVDEATSPQLREQAATELAWLAEQLDDDGQQLAPGADPANWWPLRELSDPGSPVVAPDQPIRLTGSEVEQLLNCPRQWFCANRAQGQTPRGTAAAFGTLVHALIAQAAEQGVAAAGLQDELEAGWPKLAFAAQWVEIAEREAALVALTNYDNWASARGGHQLLGVEVQFELPLEVAGEQIVLVGTVDRLERDADGRLRVIDFKTGRNPRSREEVAAMCQLGVYQLAARAGVFDQLSGGTRELGDAEVVYLRPASGGAAVARFQPALGPDEQTWVHELVAQAARIIRAEDFFARANPGCGRCPFLIGCPVQAAGVE